MTAPAALRDKVIELFRQYTESEVTPSARLGEDLGFDSLDLVETYIDLEDEFAGLEIDDGDYTIASTVQDVADVVARRLTP